MTKQLALFSNDQKLFHGGALVQGQRKTIRPLCSRRPLHLVLKARRNILFAHKSEITELIYRYGKRFSLKIYSLSIQHDHIHALIKINGRKNYVAFIRSLSGQIARRLGKNIFKVLPFTRVAAWGKGFRQVKHYILQNEKEVLGLQEYTPRQDFYKKYRGDSERDHGRDRGRDLRGGGKENEEREAK